MKAERTEFSMLARNLKFLINSNSLVLSLYKDHDLQIYKINNKSNTEKMNLCIMSVLTKQEKTTN